MEKLMQNKKTIAIVAIVLILCLIALILGLVLGNTQDTVVVFETNGVLMLPTLFMTKAKQL